ncbi:nitric-oxide reductase large subunit [Companilactobacillus suantsaicola]|uniref:Nitric-oxide reductase large subunit n=1 Tax=Companilactobacillus suantsaicola TaxID=2487723 RepID=A0A4Z0JJ87_9LACO|nr:cbb3-type cytochrome c oxidase subunit I [Companilactobacillus suantsaicola]TGD22909.1 nitric-oxide reductase large subunit [Companilactobacillus suantsaicola]
MQVYKRLNRTLLWVLVIAFSILIAGGFLIFKNEAPRPSKMVDESGTTIVTKKQLLSGQAVYEKYGLTDYGSYLGNGTYFGPDYTAQSLHVYIQGMQNYYAQKQYNTNFKDLSVEKQSGIKGKVKHEIRKNRYNSKTDQLVLTTAQVAGLNHLTKHFRHEFRNNPHEAGLPENMIHNNTDDFMQNGDKIDQLTYFFFWGAWLSSTNRPHQTYSYTNNWPYDLDAGNIMTSEAMVWTALSVAVLVAGVGVVIYFYKKYHFDMQFNESYADIPEIRTDEPISNSQRKTAKFFLIVMLMFLVQILLGELMSHYYVEDTFFGLQLQYIWPFNLAKTWHLQLVIFWIATAWLATGIYITPRVLGREPKRQGILVDILFWALIVVVGGSMLGEWGSTLGFINGKWWIFGHYGWEYAEMGKFWQILFIIGMFLWILIMLRGFVPAIKVKKNLHRSRLLQLLIIGSIAIPAFYLASLFILPNSHVTFADYWRWWIVHLWVEGIFESFAVILIGYLMVDMKLTTIKSTIRALYFQLILLLGTGVVGMGHHYFWEGDHSIWLALGACFSALEVIPLCLLVWEAYTHYRVYKDSHQGFPYKGTFMFLVSTGLWNALGAGALGFLINAPAINYFEHGTQWTSAHAHASMAGVYGFFSVAIMLFAIRHLTETRFWTAKVEKWIKWACITMNVGLAGMVFITLMPLGYLQLKDALENGYWHARQISFYRQPLETGLTIARAVPDIIFTVGVVILLVVFFRAMFHLKTASKEINPVDYDIK